MKIYFAGQVGLLAIAASVVSVVTGAGTLVSLVQSHPLASTVVVMTYAGASLLFIPLANYADFRTWQHRFRFAGLASRISMAKLFPTRAMDLSFVTLGGRLYRLSLRSDDAGPRPIRQSAFDFFDTFLTSKKSRGFIVHGLPAAGKTRLVLEWITRQHPDAFVIIPWEARPEVVLQKRLRRHDTVCIVLDDLDGHEEFVQHFEEIARALDELPVRWTIAATVRNGGPSALVLNDARFRGIASSLDHVVLERLTREQVSRVARALSPGVDADDLEPTFSWLLDKQFEEMARRYQFELTQEERSLLQAARFLEARAIPLSIDRWFGLADEVFSVPRGHQDSLRDSLFRSGFLVGRFPDPLYLDRVVAFQGTDVDDQRAWASFARLFDTQALFYWASSTAAPHPEKALTMLPEVIKRCIADQAFEPAAIASVDVAVALQRSGRDAAAFDEFESALNDAVAFGLAAETKSGFEIAVFSVCYLGNAFVHFDCPSRAVESGQRFLEAAAENLKTAMPLALAEVKAMLATAYMQIGLQSSAYDEFAEASQLCEGSTLDKAMELLVRIQSSMGVVDCISSPDRQAHLRRAIGIARACRSDLSLFAGTSAALILGESLKETDVSAAIEAFSVAVELARASRDAETLSAGAHAARELSNIAQAAGDVGLEERSLESAVEIALMPDANGPGLKEEGAKAALALGTVKKVTADKLAAWDKCVKMGLSSGTVDGVASAVLGLANTAICLRRSGEWARARNALQRALELAPRSNSEVISEKVLHGLREQYEEIREG